MSPLPPYDDPIAQRLLEVLETIKANQEILIAQGQEEDVPTGWLKHLGNWLESTPLERTLDELAYILDNFGLFKVLAAMGNLALLFAVVSWITGGEDRLKEKHYQAWAVINTAASVQPNVEQIGDATRILWGSTGEGGRVKAIEELHEDEQSLDGLQAPGAYLKELDLRPHGSFGWEGAKCLAWWPWGCADRAYLNAADLEGADLFRAKLNQADLRRANFRDANTKDATLSEAELVNSNWTGAFLDETDLTRADLEYATLDRALLLQTNLTGAKLEGATFTEAVLLGTILNDATIDLSQLQDAYVCNVVGVGNSDAERNRDCDTMAAVMVEKMGWSPKSAQERIDRIRQGN